MIVIKKRISEDYVLTILHNDHPSLLLHLFPILGLSSNIFFSKTEHFQLIFSQSELYTHAPIVCSFWTFHHIPPPVEWSRTSRAEWKENLTSIELVLLQSFRRRNSKFYFPPNLKLAALYQWSFGSIKPFQSNQCYAGYVLLTNYCNKNAIIAKNKSNSRT